MNETVKKSICLILSAITVFTASVFYIGAVNTSELKTGDIIEFGTYPQSEVTDETKIEELNNLIVGKSWKSMGYYSGNGVFNQNDIHNGAGSEKRSDYTKCIDVESDGVKYRAITFTEYRPTKSYYAAKEYNAQNYNNIKKFFIDEIYWFQFDPIEWMILDPDSGLAVSKNILDAQSFNNETTVPNPTDYSGSSLKVFLENDFFNDAFSDEEKEQLSENKAFLLSKEDFQNDSYGFNNDESLRQAVITKYDIANGLTPVKISDNFYAVWWLNNRHDEDEINVHTVSSSGNLSYADYATVDGVRPAIILKNDQVNPGNPATPDEPETPVTPVTPTSTDTPVNPDTPVTPVTPTGTDIPTDPGNGDNKEEPADPVDPDKASPTDTDENKDEGESGSEEAKYKLNYIINDETIKTVSYKAGEKPEEFIPEITGYDFVEWFGLPETMPAKDVNATGVITAKNYTLTLNAGGGYFDDGSAVKTETVAYGTYFKLAIPLRDGYMFTGWDKEEVPKQMPADDLTLTAQWAADTNVHYKIIKHKQNIDGKYESEIIDKVGITNSPVTVIPDEIPGFTFDKSKSNTEAVISYDGTTELNLYYTRNKYKAKFIYSEERTEEKLFYYEETIVPPVLPEFEGYDVSWNNEIPEKMPDFDLSFGLVKTPRLYNVKFIIGSSEINQTVAYGDRITVPEYTSRIPSDKVFKKWDHEIPDTMPAYNLTFNAELHDKEKAKTPEISIVNASNYAVDYKTTIKFHADFKYTDAGNIVWLKDGEKAGTGENFTVEKPRNSYNIKAVVVIDGETVAESGVQYITVRSSLFNIIMSFFRRLFNPSKFYIDQK